MFYADISKTLTFGLKARFLQIRQTKDRESLICTELSAGKGVQDHSFSSVSGKAVSSYGFNGT